MDMSFRTPSVEYEPVVPHGMHEWSQLKKKRQMLVKLILDAVQHGIARIRPPYWAFTCVKNWKCLKDPISKFSHSMLETYKKQVQQLYYLGDFASDFDPQIKAELQFDS
jgi:hypothetical protein